MLVASTRSFKFIDNTKEKYDKERGKEKKKEMDRNKTKNLLNIILTPNG